MSSKPNSGAGEGEPDRVVYEVRAERDDGGLQGYGAVSTRPVAEELMKSARDRWDAHSSNRWWIEKIDPAAVWTVPSAPTPRDRYRCRVVDLTEPGKWSRVHVEVWRDDELVAEYDRNYTMMDTFEPFRQGDRDFALISTDYTATAVVDLQTGDIIAAEEPDPNGFCPVGFYVPDWWDLHDGTRLFPGTLWWKPADHEWPTGDFGFVWGCVWGDDHSWKVQYLDLSRIQDGVIARDDRFGVVHLHTDGAAHGRDQIKCSSVDGERRVVFYTDSYHALDTGDTMSSLEFD